MIAQITRNNHYVPQWYQRGFLPHGQAMLHVLSLFSSSIQAPALSKASPKRLFCEYDLYTTKLGNALNDDIEKHLFGAIDKSGAEAVRTLLREEPVGIHNYFQSLFGYLDIQRLRTPKGLDWICARYGDLAQIDLMVEMQSLRYMHCAMWTECVREVVSAKNSPVKFLVSDHPITIYHRDLPPEAQECRYPHDPGIELIGSQTIFPLDANHCLILTNLEYAQSPKAADLMMPRTHARYRGQSLVRTDAFIRKRELCADEIIAINYVIKSRARQYVAAGDINWLNPEHHNSRGWREIAEILLPRDELWQFGGEIIVGYEDGTSYYQDAFGRTSRAHEYLSKKLPEAEPNAGDYCPCGSGSRYKNCCSAVSPHERPSWTSYSIRERNVMFCNAVRDVLGLDDGKDWSDVQRNLSNDQVKKIHEIFESLWPEDTLLREILPRPNKSIIRALFLGHLDPRTLPFVATGWLNYFDELVLPHPFLNARGMTPQYSPTKSPQCYKDQTLRNVLMLLQLEPHIRAGSVHLVPDPADLDHTFRREMIAMAERRRAKVKLSAEDKRVIEALGRDDEKRWLLRSSKEHLKALFRKRMPEMNDYDLEKSIEKLKDELENDPLALLQPVEPGESGAQLLTVKGFNLEAGLYVASLTSSIIYCQMDAMWNLLHEPEKSKQVVLAEGWSEIVNKIGQIKFALPLLEETENGEGAQNSSQMSQIIKMLAQEARRGASANLTQLQRMLAEICGGECVGDSTQQASCISVCLNMSVPEDGFQRKEVTRLLLTYGLSRQIHPIPLAFQIRLV